MDDPHRVRETWRSLGRQLAQLRLAAGFSQKAFGEQMRYSRSSIGNIETGLQHVDRSFWANADRLFAAGGGLLRGYEAAEALQRSHQKPVSSVAVGVRRDDAANSDVVPRSSPVLPGIEWSALMPSAGFTGSIEPSTASANSSLDADHCLWAPPGRALPGLKIPAQLHPAVLDEQAVTRVPSSYADDPFLQRPGRGLVVGQTVGADPAAYLLDSRYARKRLRGAGRDARLLIPRAYRLDDLTFALLWAVANFDEALLADDAVLAASVADSVGYTLMNKSAASRDMAADASPASRMWIGSRFCADHIRRHTDCLTDTPVFWTREQCGEEAATWLLFAHKLDYLRATSGSSSSASGDPIVRAFCVPRDAVITSPPGERTLLLLAIALMESLGIHVAVTDVPELAGTPGFVTDRRRQAITATWVGADGIWYVDLADDRSTLCSYRDAAGHATSHSVIAAPTAGERLRNLAAYLEVDWQWLTVRCTELADYGTAALVQPRSRLLSLAGVDQACRFIAGSSRSAD